MADQIGRVRGDGAAGDVAVVYDHNRKLAAVGLYDPFNEIRVRILHHGGGLAIDDALVCCRLDEALARRIDAFDERTTGWRVVYGESDALPGLVIDRYSELAVVKIYSAVWVRFLPAITEWLRSRMAIQTVVLRTNRAMMEHAEELGVSDGALLGGTLPADGRVQFLEDGLIFEVDPVHGQKTGFFLDQRDNRRQLGRISAGMRVLNIFSYSGGFSLQAAAGGSSLVWSVDLSPGAIADADRHFELNRAQVGACEHRGVVGDAFDVMKGDAKALEWDIVVVDPPAFATNRKHAIKALAAYRSAANLAARLVRPGGTLVLASCSRPITAPEFLDACTQGIQRAGRDATMTDLTGHAVDHPTDFPGLAYLKCAWFEVVR
jgi:23S rRNA (cytosine1962-C5)-methyltransferase